MKNRVSTYKRINFFNFLYLLFNFLNNIMSTHKYHFNVAMSCSGCSGAVGRALNKLDGVSDVDISLENQTVDVETANSVDYSTVYSAIEKTGKKINDGKTIR